jgi:hypothetical protein
MYVKRFTLLHDGSTEQKGSFLEEHTLDFEKSLTNSLTNIFQEDCAGYKYTIDLNHLKYQGDVFVYAKDVFLTSLKQNVKKCEGGNNRNRRTQISAGCAQDYWHWQILSNSK